MKIGGWRRAAAALAAGAALLGLSGCYDSRELDTLSFITGVGLDKSEQPGLVSLTVQIGKATTSKAGKNGGDSSESATVMMDAINPSLLGALETLRRDNSRTLFLQHNQVVIFGEEQAREGIMPYLDAMMRDYETRMEVWMLVAAGSAKDVLDTSLEQEDNTAIGIHRMIQAKNSVDECFNINLLHLVNRIQEKTTAPLIPVIEIIDENPGTRLSLTGMAVFKGDRMVGRLTEREAYGYIWMKGTLKNGMITISTVDGQGVAYITNASARLTPVLRDDGGLTMKVKIKADMSLGEITGYVGMDMRQTIAGLEHGACEEVRMQMMECLRTAQTLSADIYGFGANLRKHHPGIWEKVSGNWDTVFSDMELEPDIELSLKDLGKIGNSLQMQEGQR